MGYFVARVPSRSTVKILANLANRSANHVVIEVESEKQSETKGNHKSE